MSCDCKGAREIRWIRVNIEQKAICSVCGRDIPPEELNYHEEYYTPDSFDFRLGKSKGDRKLP